jgi:putative ATP-dependent endonuclease of OLD family
MQLARLRLMNFQSFGPTGTTIELEQDTTYLLGPNGSGKSSVLLALARMFSIEPTLRRVQRSDFHVPVTAQHPVEASETLWIEADFEASEPSDGNRYANVPAFFEHMRLVNADGPLRVRIRLTASTDDIGDVEEKIVFVNEIDADDEPTNTTPVDRYDRSAIQLHYLPAQRNPRQHLAHTANSLLGRLLRAVDWTKEEAAIAELTQQVTESLESNPAVSVLGNQLAALWSTVRSGHYFNTPSLTFTGSDVRALLRHLDIVFDSAPGTDTELNWSRLSDGEQSLLYLTLVFALHKVGEQVLAGNIPTVEPAKLRPASFTLIAVEEPENSLSPHYLGRVMNRIKEFATSTSSQALIASHAPAVVRRTPPTSIRHLRLDQNRTTMVSRIQLPNEISSSYKFVREAVESFPELYFSRLVVLGEGDSEQIVLPRLIEARGVSTDIDSISVVPLGGRHVNHFWRLLDGLSIPYLTVLDFDLARYRGGWGRIRYILQNILKHPGTNEFAKKIEQKHVESLPEWDDVTQLVREHPITENWLKFLEACGVYFSFPLDLDFAMMTEFQSAYSVTEDELEDPDEATLKAVLGKARFEDRQYDEDERRRFAAYHRHFKNDSKPVQHIAAMSKISDEELAASMPESLARMADRVAMIIESLPE